MRRLYLLNAAFCTVFLGSLIDGDQARATASNATALRLSMLPSERHELVQLNALPDEDTSAAVANSGDTFVVETNHKVPDSEERTNEKVAELVESSVHQITDVANKVGDFARSESPMNIAILRSYKFMDFQTFKRTEKFWEIAKGEEPMDASALARLLKRTQGGPTYVDRSDVIDTMLLLRSPLDVAQVLNSLRMIKGMEREADVLHVLLLKDYMDDPGRIPYKWMQLGLHPEKLFGFLGLRWKRVDDVSLHFLSEWFSYIELYRTEHSSAFSAEDALKLLFHEDEAKEVYAFIRKVAEHAEFKALADMLRKLYDAGVERRTKGATLFADEYNAWYRTKVNHYNDFWNVVNKEGPMDASGLRLVVERSNLFFLLHALLNYRSAVDVAQVLVSLRTMKGLEDKALQMLRKLWYEYPLNSNEMLNIWIQLGSGPEKLFEVLGLRCELLSDVMQEFALLWFSYVEQFHKVHPHGFSAEDAAKLFFADKGAEEVDAWLKKIGKYDEDKEVAEKLHKLYQKTTMDGRTEKADMRLAKRRQTIE